MSKAQLNERVNSNNKLRTAEKMVKSHISTQSHLSPSHYGVNLINQTKEKAKFKSQAKQIPHFQKCIPEDIKCMPNFIKYSQELKIKIAKDPQVSNKQTIKSMQKIHNFSCSNSKSLKKTNRIAVGHTVQNQNHKQTLPNKQIKLPPQRKSKKSRIDLNQIACKCKKPSHSRGRRENEQFILLGDVFYPIRKQPLAFAFQNAFLNTCRNEDQQPVGVRIPQEPSSRQISSQNIDLSPKEQSSASRFAKLQTFASIIQRWWRSILKKKALLNQRFFQSQRCEAEQQTLDNFTKSDLVFPGQNVGEIAKQKEEPPKSDSKMIAEKQLEAEQSSAYEQQMFHREHDPHSLLAREAATKSRLKTEQEALRELLNRNAITISQYHRNSRKFLKRYAHQMEEIDLLRQLLLKNTHKAKAALQWNSKHLRSSPADILAKCHLAGQVNVSEDSSDHQNQSDHSRKSESEEQSRCIQEQFQRDKTAFNSPVSPQQGKGSMAMQFQPVRICHNFQEADSCEAYGEIRDPFPGCHISAQAEKVHFEEDSDKEEQPKTYQDQSKSAASMIDEQMVKEAIEMRIALQVGAVPCSYQVPQIDTSVVGVHRLLSQFLHFYLSYYKDDFLKMVNMPYGFSIQQRLRIMQGYQLEGVEEDTDGFAYGIEAVIEDYVLEEFYDHVHSYAQSHSGHTFYQKIHFRAVFDFLNQAINQYRPYYSIKGCPYPWSCMTKALTFYLIGEDNISEVLEKSELKILKKCSNLCGVMPSFQGEEQPNFSKYGLSHHHNYQKYWPHPAIIQNRENRLIVAQMTELETDWGSHQEYKTAMLLETAFKIFEDLMEELLSQSVAQSELWLMEVGSQQQLLYRNQ